MVASGLQTASPDGSGNLHRMESSSQTHVLPCSKRIQLVVKAQPHYPARCCRTPGDTAPSSDIDAPCARLSVDGRLSRANDQYSSENIPGCRVGLYTACRNLSPCRLGLRACKYRGQRRAGPIPASRYPYGKVCRWPSLSVGPRWPESRCRPMPLTVASQWQSPSWPLPMAVMVSPRACWSRAWRAEEHWFGGTLSSRWHTYIHASPLLTSRNPYLPAQ